MGTIFQILLILYICTVLFVLWVRREFFSSGTYIVVGVCVPLILYLLKWSDWITDEPCAEFYLIFISLFLCGGFFMLLQGKRLEMTGHIYLKQNVVWVYGLNALWIVSVLLENYIGTGYFFPALSGVDMHTNQVPLLLYITRAKYVIIAVDVICYFIRHQKRYIALGLIHILLPIISASSRMMATVAMIQAASLFVFLWANGHGAKSVLKRRRKISGWHIAIIAGLAVAAVVFLVRIGIHRMNHYGKYAVLYSQGIRYTGPLGEVGAWLYGYFALAFDNLNMSIIAGRENPNYIGIFSFPSFYYGILQFDNLIGLPNHFAQKSCEFNIPAAIVPTGFWSFYYDYGILCFIPIVAAFVQEFFLRWKASMSANQVVWVALYFHFIPHWTLMNFTNTVFDVTMLTTAIIGYVVFRWLFGSVQIREVRRMVIVEE